uniref:Secreted protein n=1 Tax=Aegilops tauschii subsp. strangulata TaxID=200361 RepID=A0A453E8T2_AEGTS
MVSPFSPLACLLMSIFFELSCRNFNLLCRIHFFRETVGRVQNIFLQKMCYCAETTMKLSGRRSSELGYIGLGQSDCATVQFSMGTNYLYNV